MCQVWEIKILRKQNFLSTKMGFWAGCDETILDKVAIKTLSVFPRSLCSRDRKVLLISYFI